MLFVQGKTPDYYIKQAGSYIKMADKRRTIVTYPNGTVWQPRWFILPDPALQPGSDIFVPEKPEVKDIWEVIRDTTAILTSFSTILLLIWRIS